MILPRLAWPTSTSRAAARRSAGAVRLGAGRRAGRRCSAAAPTPMLELAQETSSAADGVEVVMPGGSNCAFGRRASGREVARRGRRPDRSRAGDARLCRPHCSPSRGASAGPGDPATRDARRLSAADSRKTRGHESASAMRIDGQEGRCAATKKPSTTGLGLETLNRSRDFGLQDLHPGFDRGAAMPYVERNSDRVQTMSNPEAWLQAQTE